MRTLIVLVALLPATALADSRASLDIVGGPLLFGAQTEGQRGDHDWHAHFGGGFALRAHDIAPHRALDLELGWDRIAWHSGDRDYPDFHRYRLTLTSWREYRRGAHLLTLSAGGGFDVLGGRVMALDHAGSGDIDELTVRTGGVGIVATGRASYLFDLGPIDLGLELVGSASLVVFTIEYENLTPRADYRALELQLRAVIRI